MTQQTKIIPKDEFKIVYDAQQGRMEIPVGTGRVTICVGYKIGYAHYGGLKSRVDVPIYETRIF